MSENDGSGFLPHECVFRKLASERLERVTELAAENGELKHQLDGVVQELTEAQNGYNDHVALSRRLTAELTTAREDTRRAERDWTKALAERDEARAQRDAAQTELATAHADVDVDSQIGQNDEYWKELATVRAERDAAREGCAQYYKERNSLLESHLPTLKRKEELLAELATTRAALSTLEQAAWEAVWSWNGYRLYGREIDKWGDMTALERALNEVSK